VPQLILNVVVTETGTAMFPTGPDGPIHAGIDGEDPRPQPPAPVYAHVSVAVPGPPNEVGLAVRVRVGGGTATRMVTDVVSPAPQLIVNVVVTEMGTESVPDIPGKTPPHNGFTGEALLVHPGPPSAQVSITDPGPLNDEGTPEIESAAEAVKGTKKKGSVKTLKRIFFSMYVLYARVLRN